MSTLSVVEIPENRNYWFVRTQAGRWFDDFIAGSYIAIGWNAITIDRISEEKSEVKLHDFIRKRYPKEERFSLTASHMMRFVKYMRPGDIVVIPSQRGSEFVFGEITGDAFTYNGTIEQNQCPFIKRRSVKWLKRVPSSILEPVLRSIKYAQPAVNSLNTYSELIDNELGGFLYVKGNKGYVVVRVEENHQIRAKDLADFLTTSLEAVKKLDPNVNINDIYIKLNVQSPGPITWIAGVGAIFILASAIYISTPGEYKFDIKAGPVSVSASMQTQGFSEAVIKYKAQQHSQEMEKLRMQQEKLGIRLPEPADKTINTNDKEEK